MASFFSKLFGGGKAEAPVADPVEYKGYRIDPAPLSEGGQWRLGGAITKQTDTGPLVRQFVRADVFTTRDEAVEFSTRKGRQIIDEQGERLFADGAETGRA